MLGLHTRARRTSLVIEWFACNPTVRVGEWFWCACVRHGTTRRFAPRFGRGASRPEQPRPHSADTCARSRPGAGAEPFPTRQVTVARGLALSALFGQRTTPDSAAFRPLHSAQRTASQTARIASLRSDGAETAETGRTARAHPGKEKNPEAAMLRISAKTPQYGREASPGQDIGISREHGQLSLHCVTRNCPPSLERQIMV